MLFRQLLDLRSSTFTYLLADSATREAVLIDPVYELVSRDAALLRELDLRLLYTVETHIHADHVTGAWRLHNLLGSRIALSANAGAEGADLLLRDDDVLIFGRYSLHVMSTPGHTDSCLSLLTDTRDKVFTGDSLMIRAAGRTDFQQGDARRLYRSVHDRLFSLPDECLVYPGHDYSGRTCTSIGEEKAFNPRLGGNRSAEDFVGYMSQLGLPHPNQMAIAVPANLRCGRPELPTAPEVGEWEPALRSFAGVLEVPPEWLVEHLREVTVVDVRTPSEYVGELGHIAGARSIPLGQLRSELDSLPRSQRIIAVCRSGGRSAQASLILEKAGFPRVASLNGGMIGWHSLELEVA